MIVIFYCYYLIIINEKSEFFKLIVVLFLAILSVILIGHYVGLRSDCTCDMVKNHECQRYNGDSNGNR